MRRCLVPLVACSLFTVTACSTSQGLRSGSEQGQATAITLTLCKVLRASFDDSASDDGRPTVGDSYNYTVNVSTATGPKACDEATGQFFGVEELVQELPAGEGASNFLTNFQGTFVLPDGNLQLRSMGYVSVKADEMAQMKRSGPVALGLGDDLAHSSIRFSLGRFTTEEEVDYAIEALVKGVNHMRDLSPIWEMYKEGVDIDSIEWSEH